MTLCSSSAHPGLRCMPMPLSLLWSCSTPSRGCGPTGARRVQRLRSNAATTTRRPCWLPLSDARLRREDLEPILDALAKRLPGWTCKLIALPARIPFALSATHTDPETALHLIAGYPFSRQVWAQTAFYLGRPFSDLDMSMAGSLRSRFRRPISRATGKAACPCLLVSWCLWKERNDRIFKFSSVAHVHH